MAAFSEESFIKKLEDLNPSQQSIQTLSLWLIHHRKHSKKIVEIWFRELKQAKPAKKLTFLYLANDVVQNSKKKGPEYGRDFKTGLLKAYMHVPKHVDEKVHASMARLLTIWKERTIFDLAVIGAMQRFLDSGKEGDKGGREGEKREDEGADEPPVLEVEKPDVLAKMKEVLKDKKENGDPRERRKERKREKHARREKERKERGEGGKKVTWQSLKDEKEDKGGVGPPSKKKKKNELSLIEEVEREMDESDDLTPPNPKTLVAKLEELENSASSDAAVREKIAALPPEVSDISMLDKLEGKPEAMALVTTVDEACELLTEYNGRLSGELDERKQVAVMLRCYITSQKEALAAAETELLEHKAKLERVSVLRRELKQHIQNLPDLSQLPKVAGLLPLPSAGDLFSLGEEPPT